MINGIDSLLCAYRKKGYEVEPLKDNVLLMKKPLLAFVVLQEDTRVTSLDDFNDVVLGLDEYCNMYGVFNIIYISTAGYTEDCSVTDDYCHRLEGQSYLDDVLSSNKAPLELLPYNSNAVGKVLNLWKTNKPACVVHATGTGKSYITLKILKDGCRKSSVVCPTLEIIEQYIELLKEYNVPLQNVDFLTYAKLASLSRGDIKELNSDIFVLDEFHRAGAARWGVGVKRFLEVHPDSNVLGITATPIRYLDGARNMADELFRGNVVSEIDLFDAITRGILTPPKYIQSIYDISYDIDKARESVNKKDYSEATRNDVLNKIKKFKISWNNVSCVSKIIKKHLSLNENKIIIFCKNVEHLNAMKPKVEEWFRDSGVFTKVSSFLIYSSKHGSMNEMVEFKKEPLDGEVKLLFSVDKVSEGIHTSTNCCIFLRNTLSGNVYLQQMGRVMQANSNYKPVILDLINNSELLQSIAPYNKVDVTNSRETDDIGERRSGKLLDVAKYNFEIIDETKDFVKFLEEVRQTINASWENMFDRAVDCHKRTGWFPGPATPNEDKALIKWVKTQRSRYTSKSLSEKQIDKLLSANFPFSYTREKWLAMYSKLVDYLVQNDVFDMSKHLIKDTSISRWAASQRSRKKKGLMDETEEILLKAVNFNFNYHNDLWDYYFDKLVEFNKEHGHLFPTEQEDKDLHIYVARLRRKYSKGEIPTEKLEKLEDIGFEWENVNKRKDFTTRINQLTEFKRKYGHCNPSPNDEEFDGLGRWVGYIRNRKVVNNLSNSEIESLNELGFIWNLVKDKEDRSVQNIIAALKKKNANPDYNFEDWWDFTSYNIRKKYAKGLLDKHTIDSLSEAGFVFDPLSETWKRRVNQLKDYHQKFNTFKIMSKCGFEDVKGLGKWLVNQRALYKKGSYPAERYDELLKIGVDLSK